MGRYRQVQTEKDAKSYAARIWWALWLVCFFVLFYTAWQQLIEFDLVHNGQSITATYNVYKGAEIATYRDDANHYYSFDVSGLDARHEEDTIEMYYKDSIYSAQPRVRVRTWVKSYVLFGIGLILLSIKLWRIYTSNQDIYDVGSTLIDTDIHSEI